MDEKVSEDSRTIDEKYREMTARFLRAYPISEEMIRAQTAEFERFIEAYGRIGREGEDDAG
jgi:hypothetical protein